MTVFLVQWSKDLIPYAGMETTAYRWQSWHIGERNSE